jgi:hypothetical protein
LFVGGEAAVADDSAQVSLPHGRVESQRAANAVAAGIEHSVALAGDVDERVGVLLLAAVGAPKFG